jgi:hypothetical protein
MRMILGGVAAAFAVCLLWTTPAAAEAIQCPLSQARRTITNDLPSGWWTTPIVNNLSETRVQEIGGSPALVCVYGPSGSVQREAPANHTCTARTGGFDCTPNIRLVPLPIPVPTIPTNPGTYRTAALSVPQTYVFDLDAGTVGAQGDIWFQAVTSDELYLTPRGGAQLAVGDRSNRNYEGCVTAAYSPNRVALSAVPVGSYVCVRTSDGRISQFRMNSITPGSPKTLSIGFTTWNN